MKTNNHGILQVFPDSVTQGVRHHGGNKAGSAAREFAGAASRSAGRRWPSPSSGDEMGYGLLVGWLGVLIVCLAVVIFARGSGTGWEITVGSVLALIGTRAVWRAVGHVRTAIAIARLEDEVMEEAIRQDEAVLEDAKIWSCEIEPQLRKDDHE